MKASVKSEKNGHCKVKRFNMTVDRRKFLTSASLLTGSSLISNSGCGSTQKPKRAKAGKIQNISEVTNPLAITMVDYSWMLKHHRYGAYEDYDQFFTELVKRGYNAVRMDCFHT